MDDSGKAPLIPERYEHRDLFVCDVEDAVLKDFMSQMEHPFYSLSKKPDTEIREYTHGDKWIRIIPSARGQATIYDKDILIYAISQMIAKERAGGELSKRVRINSRDFLMFTNRGTAGKDYTALIEALERIRGTTITTNIETGGLEQTKSFGLIEDSTVTRMNGIDGRLLWVEVTLSDWVFNAIEAKQVLTLHRDYFRLRRPLEKRIYEIARKHCGQQASWKVSIDVLMNKSGSRSPAKVFKQMLAGIVKTDHLPDYHLSLDSERSTVTFSNRGTMPFDRDKPYMAWEGKISTKAYQDVKELRISEDVYALEIDFREWVSSNQVEPRNPDAMFIDFCIKRQARTRDLFSTY